MCVCSESHGEQSKQQLNKKLAQLAQQLGGSGIKQLAPHRAVYQLTLMSGHPTNSGAAPPRAPQGAYGQRGGLFDTELAK